MNLYRWYLDWCYRKDTEPFVRRLRACANLVTHWKRRGPRGQYWDFCFSADFLETLGEF